MRLLRTFFVICTLLLATTFTYADDTATVEFDPETPAPNSQVTLTLVSYYFNVNVAKITWQVNGAIVAKGVGEKKIVIRTGDVGQVTNVVVLIENADGSSVQQNLSITPASVTLLYEAPGSYTPLLYKGRSLPGDGGIVRVTALPQFGSRGGPVSGDTVAYSWYVNDEYIDSASGYGKQVANLRMDYLNEETEIKVLATSQTGIRAEKTISIQPHAVMPLLYLHDPILGTRFKKLLDKRFETTKDFTLILEPFYVSKELKGSSPTYSWFLDGLPSTPLDGRMLAFQPEANSLGSKILKVMVQGPNQYLQKANNTLELIFDTRK